MSMEYLTNIELLSIRARIAYCLYLAASILVEIKRNKDGYIKAEIGLDKCWEWISGDSCIHGEDICDLLSNENDTGLGIYSSSQDNSEIEYSAWGVIIYTIAYTAWQAFNYDKQGLPSIIESIDDDTIIEIFEYLQKTAIFEEKYALNIKNTLLEKFPFDPTNELGDPINKSLHL
jgi:hypothetical protein